MPWALWVLISHRAAGLLARARGVLRRQPVDDGVLVERVRAKLGRLVSHPHAVDVNAIDGYVRLRGAVLQSEVPRLVRAVARVPGVRDVINALNVRLSADNPALQGGRTRTRVATTERDIQSARRFLIVARACHLFPAATLYTEMVKSVTPESAASRARMGRAERRGDRPGRAGWQHGAVRAADAPLQRAALPRRPRDHARRPRGRGRDAAGVRQRLREPPAVQGPGAVRHLADAHRDQRSAGARAAARPL